jgi:RNA polymerase sigma-70 factor (ECF subfamily)
MLTHDDLERHRSRLTGHCYRMLGSIVDADEAVQETLIRAWRGLSGFDGRSQVQTWLHRIATHVCLDLLADRARRERPIDAGEPGRVTDALVERPRVHWLEPVPDASVLPAEANPAELLVLKESIRLAFVAALQHLAPKQRAALLFTDVLGWSVLEVAEALDTSVPAVNSALQRARATLATRQFTDAEVADARADLDPARSALLRRYVDAFERYDLPELTSLLCEDATLSMPPYALWLRGPEVIAAWLAGRGCGCRGSRLVPTSANGLPAFAQYRPSPEGGHSAWALILLELRGDRIAAWNSFLDTRTLFPRFGLPLRLGAGSAREGE